MTEKYQLVKPGYIKRRKRIGCGIGSGHGKTSGKGTKGQRSRSGSKKRAWFEGGQMPLQRRIPKRGFHNVFGKDYQIVNCAQLEKCGTKEITPEAMEEMRIIRHGGGLVKILGNGEVTKSLRVTADKFSKSATEKIKKAGGETITRKASPAEVQ